MYVYAWKADEEDRYTSLGLLALQQLGIELSSYVLRTYVCALPSNAIVNNNKRKKKTHHTYCSFRLKKELYYDCTYKDTLADKVALFLYESYFESSFSLVSKT